MTFGWFFPKARARHQLSKVQRALQFDPLKEAQALAQESIDLYESSEAYAALGQVYEQRAAGLLGIDRANTLEHARGLYEKATGAYSVRLPEEYSGGAQRAAKEKLAAVTGELLAEYNFEVTVPAALAKWDGKSSPSEDAIYNADRWAGLDSNPTSAWWAGVAHARAYAATGRIADYNRALWYSELFPAETVSIGRKQRKFSDLGVWIEKLRAAQ